MSHEIEAIEKMSYPDFVAYLGQVNTPPGAKSTLQYWIQNAGIGEKSHLFDLACTTGFSSRTIVTERGGRALGIDISKPAIDVANRTAASVGLAERLTYVHGDACAIPAADGAFTHILGGCNFAFIQDRKVALAEAARVLGKDGMLCLSNFFYFNEPPLSVIDSVEGAIGFRPNATWTKTYWEEFFSDRFELIAEVDQELKVMDEKYLRQIVRDAVFNPSGKLKDKPQEVKEACCERLFKIRWTLNKHREYQKFNLAVWKKR